VGLQRDSPRQRLATARLYAITPDGAPDAVAGLVEAWLRGGADIVQLRAGRLARGDLLDLARRVGAACRAAGALFVVNDHLDIAMLSRADAAHLGASDLSLEAARRVAGPELVIGASASTPETGRAAVAAGADYLGSGPAYTTPIKAGKPAIGPSGVALVQGAVSIPVFAIGGIDRSRIPELREAGIDRACVIRALAEAPDPEQEARLFKQALTR
jgi:thiamine-phosphate pyrophosphorylase